MKMPGKNWFLRMMKEEGDHEVSAGGATPLLSKPIEGSRACSPESESLQVAFGTLIKQLRRKQSLTVERLAEKTRTEVSELVCIEHDAKYSPRLRTVHQLAEYFCLPKRALLKLSGAAVTTDAEFQAAAVRFAARSDPKADLSPEEREALKEFVAFLSAQE